jgi:hypothetical protein
MRKQFITAKGRVSAALLPTQFIFWLAIAQGEIARELIDLGAIALEY